MLTETMKISLASGSCITLQTVFFTEEQDLYPDISVREITLYLSNAITPSKSDGLNDTFSFLDKVKKQIADFVIVIYNRWGE